MINYSIIIPHHNCPDLLQRLLFSIPQRPDIEIIIVDDNSDTGRKADVDRPGVSLFFIDKEHTQGPGKARNEGLRHACGKWILFADADDFYKEGFLDVLDEYVESDADVVYYNVESVDSDTLKPGKRNRALLHQNLIKQFDGSKYSSDILLYQGFSPWRRMIKRELIVAYNMTFDEFPLGEDTIFSLQVSAFSKKWMVDDRTVYVLTYKEGSISYSRMTKIKYTAVLKVLTWREFFYKKLGYSEWNRVCYRGKYSNSRLKFILRMLKNDHINGIKALLYYFGHYISIRKFADRYYNILVSKGFNPNL